MSYQIELAKAIEAWRRDPIEDEWVFHKFRTTAIESMSQGDAYSHLDETLKLLLDEEDESVAIEILETLICLARRSETTEIPRFLHDESAKIKNKFASRGDYANRKLGEFMRHYRIGC